MTRTKRREINIKQGTYLEEVMQADTDVLEGRNKIYPLQALAALELLGKFLVAASVSKDLTDLKQLLVEHDRVVLREDVKDVADN